MPFGQSYEQKKGTSAGENRESPYLRLKPGERVVRILDEDAVTFWQYFMDVNVEGRSVGRSIIVGGMDNPIRRAMEALGEDHPKFRRPSRRFLMNVLDRSLVIRDEKGATVYAEESGKYPIPGMPKPNNRVMLLEFGPSLMEGMLTLHNRMRHPKTGQPMSIQEFDLIIFTKGSGRDTIKNVIPAIDPDATPLPEELVNGPRYDLKLATRPLPDEAQERLLAGEDYNAVIRSLGWEPIKPVWL